jgi:uncharacterized RDD family membrane protein YckC
MSWPPGKVTPEPQVPEARTFVRRGIAFETRAVAFVVDAALILLLWFLAGRAVDAVLGNTLGRLGFLVHVQFYISQAPPAICALPGLLLLALAYFPLFEATAAGTPGKWIFMLRVLSLNGGVPKPRDAAVRSLFRVVDAAAAYSVMKPPLYQRLGDKAAGTTVATLDYAASGVPTQWWYLAVPAVLFFVTTGFLRFLVVAPFLRVR